MQVVTENFCIQASSAAALTPAAAAAATICCMQDFLNKRHMLKESARQRRFDKARAELQSKVVSAQEAYHSARALCTADPSNTSRQVSNGHCILGRDQLVCYTPTTIIQDFQWPHGSQWLQAVWMSYQGKGLNQCVS